MKRLIFALLVVVGSAACAPLLPPPKEGIEGVPAWVRRRDREERAIAKRQIEAARLRQELRAERARADEERRAAEAAAKAAELAAALAAGEHAASEGSAVAGVVVETASGGPAADGSGAAETAVVSQLTPLGPEGSAEVAAAEPATTESASAPEGSGASEGSAEVAAAEPATTESASAPEGSGASEGSAEVAAAEPAVTEPAVTEPAVTEPAATEPAVTEPAVTEPAATEPAVTEPAVTEPAATEPAPAVAPRRERQVQPLGIQQTQGRGGSYFVPEGLSGEIPLLLLFHGPGDSGATIAEPFVSLARANGFAIVAIDAVNKENGVWAFEVNNAIVHRTKELQFLAKALGWVAEQEKVTFDKSKTLAAGYSQGASIAAWTGTNERFVSHFGLLHGGFLSDGIGYEVRPVWLSTGDTDDFRTPAIHASTARALRVLGLKEVTSRVFTTNTALSKEECEALIAWWLELASPSAEPPAEPSK